MKVRFGILFLLFSLGLSLAQDNGHEADVKKPMEIEDVLALKSVGSVSISPDGRWVAYVVTVRDFEKNANDSDIWLVPFEGGDPVRLTYHKGPDSSPQWAPDSTWLAFRSNRGKKSNVWGISIRGGESWPVTENKTAVGAFRISPDGKRLAFTASEEKSKEQKESEKKKGRPMVWDEYYHDQWSRLWVAPLKERRAGEASKVSPDDVHAGGAVWSPDSKRLAFGGRPSPSLRTFRFGAVYAVDAEGGKASKIAQLPGGINPVDWSRSHGLIVSASGKELGTYNRRLWTVPDGGGEPVALTTALDENAGFVAATSDSLLVETTHRTLRRLYRIPLRQGRAAGEPQALSDDQHFYRGFSASKDGSRIAFTAESGSRPADVHAAETAAMKPRRLTAVNPQVEDFVLGEQRVVRWKSRADGEPIEGVLTLPADYRQGEKAPLLLVIHGGPAGVSSNSFMARRSAYPVQVLAGRGYAVLQPNYRGSTGYGERFRGLNRGDISGRDWVDIDSGVDEMIQRGIADPDRLGIMGWSFGGHHTFWGITQTRRYKAASAGAGANDLISMYSQTDIPEFYQTYLGPKPWEDFDLYEERSAYRFVASVTTPLLIQVGEKDERVPAEQSIQFYEAMKTIGKAETQLVLYPGQPHGVRAPRLVRDLLTRNLDWFTRWIPNK